MMVRDPRLRAVGYLGAVPSKTKSLVHSEVSFVVITWVSEHR